MILLATGPVSVEPPQSQLLTNPYLVLRTVPLACYMLEPVTILVWLLCRDSIPATTITVPRKRQ